MGEDQILETGSRNRMFADRLDPVGRPQQRFDDSAGLDVDAGEHVARPPEVVGAVVRRGNLPRRPQQDASFAIGQHKHPYGADPVAEDRNEIGMRSQQRLKLVSPAQQFDLIEQRVHVQRLSTRQDDAVRIGVVPRDVGRAQTAGAVERFAEDRIDGVVFQEPFDVVAAARA